MNKYLGVGTVVHLVLREKTRIAVNWILIVIITILTVLKEFTEEQTFHWGNRSPLYRLSVVTYVLGFLPLLKPTFLNSPLFEAIFLRPSLK